MGDLNVEGHNGFLKEFCDLYNLKNLTKAPTCFKNPDFPTSIDDYDCYENTLKKKKKKKNRYRDYSNFLQKSSDNKF